MTHPEHPFEEPGHPLFIPEAERTRLVWPPEPATPHDDAEAEVWADLPYEVGQPPVPTPYLRDRREP